MTIEQALKTVIESEEFKNNAKERNSIGSKYRQFLSRYNKGELKTGAMVDMLIEHGYRVEIKKGR